jgi:hypothetical protein
MDLFIRVVEMIWSTGGMMEGTTGRQRPPYIDKCEGFWPQGTGCEILLQRDAYE